MTMSLPRRTLLLSLAFGGLAGSAAAQGYTRAAERVLARAFAATGGSNWYLLRGWHESGVMGGIAYERWVDPVRYGLRTETQEDGGLRIDGFNGQAVWQVLPTGQILAVNDHPALAQARTTAFFTANGFFFRGRFGARGDLLGVRTFRGRSYDVLAVRPWNGNARELWFDRGSALLTRIVDRSGPKPSALQVADYRKVGPVLVPFRYAPESGAPAEARQLQSLAFPPADRGAFSLDRPAALALVKKKSAGQTPAP